MGWLFSNRRYAGSPACPAWPPSPVEAERNERGCTTTSTRYYLCSTPLTLRRFARAVRGHWAIESSLYWVGRMRMTRP
ncbi:hypothetical protein DF3PB_5660003 [uncultured Defluviicoccus sp.]|uniref:Transposase n=1 Tax=metagenome TaxID=256318 RepID=A0A380TIB5_9ZZZZ|nr:hypothetical protein DF3PB_5660003 [uncultured Defluviicoccus sp.]